MIHRGTFQLFSRDPRQPETTNLSYSFDMVSPSGRVLHLEGFKTVNSASFLNPLKLWRQTSTLYVTITEDRNRVIGRGTMSLHPLDFVRQLRTMSVDGPSKLSRVGSLARFFLYFASQLKTPFLSTLGRIAWPGEDVNAAYKVTSPAETINLTATDGVPTTMVMWNPFVGGKEVRSAAQLILFIGGAAVDHNIFALPTIEKNAVDFFRESGYRVYCLTHRIGRTPVARKGYTSFDARLDILAALTHIRETEDKCADGGLQKIYVIAHCAGSLALSCGLLDGTFPGSWIRGITASMVFMNPRFGKVNYVMSWIPKRLMGVMIKPWWECSSSPNDSWAQGLMNQVLRFYPVGEARETCRSVVCHRSQLVFGR